MQLKPTPTSPKVKNEKNDIEAFYRDKSLTKIQIPNSRNGRFFVILLAIIVGIFSGFFGGFFFYNFFNDQTSSTQALSLRVNSQDSIQPEELNDLAEKIQSSVVSIYLKKTENKSISDPRDSLYYPWEELSSGLLVTSDGWMVIPKWSITDLEQNYVAVTSKGDIYDIEKIMADPATSNYFVKIDGKNLSVLEFVKPDDVYLGQETYILTGNFFFQPGLFTSYVSQTNYNSINNLDSYIKSSDQLYQGVEIKDELLADYQGAVCVTAEGKVIGLIGSNEWPTRQIIPSEQIQSGLTSLLKNGEVIRPALGVNYIDLSKTVNLSSFYSQNQTQGALIYGNRESNQPAVLPNSAAEKAGLVKNDIITRVGNFNVDGSNSLSSLIQSYSSGDSVELEYLREGELKKISITLTFRK